MVVLIILLCLSAFFSSAETALMTVNKLRLRSLAERGNRRAVVLLKITSMPDKMLSAILIGNNIVNLYASSLATKLTIDIFGSRAIGIATGILTLLILVFGEITPKTMAAKYSEKIAFSYAWIIYILMFILTPLIFVVNLASSFAVRLFGADPNKRSEQVTEEELRTMLDVSHEEGVIEKEEKLMINNVVDFGDILARDIMIPRIDMVMAEVNTGYDELIELFRNERYTRIPVYEDSNDNIIGILNVKDLLLTDKDEEFSLREYLREPIYTYEYKKVSELMTEMRKSLSSMVIVLDEYGAGAGMITIEDMLEEIVGDIRDEYDEDEADSFVKLKEGEYLVEGSMRLDELNERLESSLSSEDYESLGGLLIEKLEHIPAEGESIELDNMIISVEKMDKARVDRVRISVSGDKTDETGE